MFSVSHFDLPATYQLIRAAIVGLTPQQAGTVAMFEGLGQSYLGMPIVDALGLFTGEFASVTSYSDEGKSEQSFAVSIQKPDAVLRILRALLGSKIVSEDSAATTTYLSINYPYRDAQTGAQRSEFYYLAVTSDMLFASSQKAVLRETVARSTAHPGSAPAGIFLKPEYSQMRARFPEKASALSGVDFTEIPWDKLLQNLEVEMAQSAKQKNGPPPPDLSGFKPDVIPSHLHMALSGWWKDSGGVYFDSYIQ
jgi:hypothetical protein